MFNSAAAEVVRRPEPASDRGESVSQRADQIDEQILRPTPEIWQGPVRITIADRPELLERVSRLVHDVYVRSGYMKPHPQGVRITPFDELPETTTFVALLNETVIATLTMVPDGNKGLPMERIYSEELRALRKKGRSVAEITSLADRRKDPRRGMAVFLGLTRLMIHTANARQIDDILIAVNPKHARFYQRVLVFEQFGTERPYPAVLDNPAVALRLDLNNVKANQKSSRRMLDRYFGSQDDGDLISNPPSAVA